MTLRNRLLLFAAAGIVVGLIVRATGGWVWDAPFTTVTGNIIYHVSYFLPFVVVAVAVGFFSRKKSIPN